MINAPYVEKQKKLHELLQEKFPKQKLTLDKLNESILWCSTPEEIVKTLQVLQSEYSMDFLSDITAYDNKDKIDGPKRFVVVYQIYSLNELWRLRLKVLVDLNESAISITDLWPAANWLEREVYDMYGINFKNHPNLKRIMMDERFTGHPLRKEYPIKLREPFADNVTINMPKAEIEEEGL